MNNPRQKYSLYRDDDLVASDLPSLPSIMEFVRNDARREHAGGRPARYLITGSLGFKRAGSHSKGRMVWDGQMPGLHAARSGAFRP
ncbi:MAG: hypothetical protein WBW41_06405 [Verrucomicrobiia bacterium]